MEPNITTAIAFASTGDKLFMKASFISQWQQAGFTHCVRPLYFSQSRPVHTPSKAQVSMLTIGTGL